MNLVDSCGWIEYFCDSDLADHYAPAIESLEELVVPTICIYEVVRKILRDAGKQQALQAMATMQLALVVDLTDTIAASAAILGTQLHLPMADSIVLATANHHKAILWTQDSHFQNTPNIRYFKKL